MSYSSDSLNDSTLIGKLTKVSQVIREMADMGISLGILRIDPGNTSHCTARKQCRQAASYVIHSSFGIIEMIFRKINSLFKSIVALLVLSLLV